MVDGFNYAAPKGGLKTASANLTQETGFRTAEFQKQFQGLLEALTGRAVNSLELFDGLTARLFTAIVEATPVDTGQARASWRISKTQEGEIFKWRIVNGVPYIIFLEYGSSKQAPQGMVRINLDRFISDLKTGIKRIADNGGS